jgi:hypothetical protein
VRGLLTINLTLADPRGSLNGDGALVSISFKVTQKPVCCQVSTIDFNNVTLLDPSSNSISYDYVAAVCFWQSLDSDPSGQGSITTSTNNGGLAYMLGSTVTISSLVTFEGDPVRNKLVAVQFVNPLDNTLTIAVGATDQNGIFAFSMAIPETISNIGNWTVFATVELDQATYWTNLSFLVIPSSTVGGYSYVVKLVQTPNLLPAYLIAFVLLALSIIVLKPRRARRHVSCARA